MVSSIVIDRDTCVREIATFLGWQIIGHNITPQVEGKVPVSDLSGLHGNNNQVQYDLINPDGQMVASGLFASDVTTLLPDWWGVTDLAFTLPIDGKSWDIYDPYENAEIQIVKIVSPNEDIAEGRAQKLSTAICLAWLEYKRGQHR